MNVHLVSNMALAELEGKNVVKAEELWESLLHWEDLLLRVQSCLAIEVSNQIRKERLSLHCEPEVQEITTWHGVDIENMNMHQLREALRSTASNFR